MSLIPGLGWSPGEGNGNPFQCSCLENSVDREAWLATVPGVTKNQTWCSNEMTTAKWLINSAEILSGGQQRDSAVHVHVSISLRLPSHTDFGIVNCWQVLGSQKNCDMLTKISELNIANISLLKHQCNAFFLLMQSVWRKLNH